MAPLAPIDWQKQLRSRIFAMFQSSNWAIPIADAIAHETTLVDSLILAMAYLFSIDPITSDATAPGYGIGRGVQLDRIGRLVGFQRTGQPDDVYRYYLRGQIRANRSHGTGNDVIETLGFVFSGAARVVIINDTATSGGRFVVRLDGFAAGPDEVTVAAYYVRKVKLAGVKAWLWYSPAPDADTFTLGTAVEYPDGDALRGLGDVGDPSVGGHLAGVLVV
jgi:hypothetical protein